MRLIQAVESQGVTIKEAAINLNINYSTAKHIIKMFKKTGEVSTISANKRKAE
jgi:predicted transcriptional regulator